MKPVVRQYFPGRAPWRLFVALCWSSGLFFATLSSPASGATLPGGDAPELARAVATWLDDDDENSLPALAELAARGNIAAALLVARIERTTRHFSPWLHSLTRSRRLALFRRPSRDLFPPTWIGWYADQGVDLAVTLKDAGLSRTGAYLVHELNDLGEPQAADTLIRRIMFYGDGPHRAQVAGANLPLPELAPYVMAMDQPGKDSRLGMNAVIHLVGPDALEGVAPDDIRQAAGFLHYGMPFQTLPAANPLHEPLSRRISEMPALKPIANQCESICPNDTAQCSLTMIGLQGGYYDAIRNDSPLESVISQKRFLNSRRGSAIALRRAALARDGAASLRATLGTVWSYSQCLGVAVRKVRESHVRMFR